MYRYIIDIWIYIHTYIHEYIYIYVYIDICNIYVYIHNMRCIWVVFCMIVRSIVDGCEILHQVWMVETQNQKISMGTLGWNCHHDWRILGCVFFFGLSHSLNPIWTHLSYPIIIFAIWYMFERWPYMFCVYIIFRSTCT